MAQHSSIQDIICAVKERYAPDKRTEIFEINVSEKNHTFKLTGETTVKVAYEELLLRMKKAGLHVEDCIRLLPDSALGEKNRGIVYNSTGTIHSAALYSSETVTQVLLGMPVKILEKQNGWLRIQTPEKYIGWINGAVEEVTPQELSRYNKQPKIIVTGITASSYRQADEYSQPVSDLVMGNILTFNEEKDGFYCVEYPDGRKAFVRKSDAKKLTEWLNGINLTGESVVNMAEKFLGVPYVWGGTSSKGLDCSGFTKTVYFNHGIILARDASQQVLYGKLIDSAGNFDNALPGDLVFFGEKATSQNPKERVVHVGIYIGNKRFIHASDYVHVSSFDAGDPLYDAYNTHRYLCTKRIIGEVNTKGIEEISKNDFYR